MAEHKNIYSALCAAQQEFGQVTKGSTNPAFRSKYADLADVATVVIPTLSKHGVAVLHYMTGEELMTMRTEFVHAASETKVSCDVPLIVEKNNMQGMKSATTYAKRIGLESLSGIAPEDDDGNAAAKASPVQTLPQRQVAPPQRQAMTQAPERKVAPPNIQQPQVVPARTLTPEQIEEKKRQALAQLRPPNLAPQTQAEAVKK